MLHDLQYVANEGQIPEREDKGYHLLDLGFRCRCSFCCASFSANRELFALLLADELADDEDDPTDCTSLPPTI